ncbi:guanylate kinase [Algisphaera agarilytica]|uniref:Guanylate kinase n=1 Tax=Algisphaera agarilytica TaxID=1385975 RepID=A0A7X0H7X6_9BACT|nr:guanylate kinase [Algisphaera agarilytica]MBB6430932.1 guanylate kinase [Algisphaera agarilytica]
MTDPADTPTETREGVLLIISGPSGVGKSTLTNALLENLDADLSVSMTTRPMSKSDVDGEHYHFVDVATFEQNIINQQFLEHAVYNGNYYGTPRMYVQQKLDRGRVVILEIDVEGARQIKSAMPDSYAIFIKPPSEDALIDRLRGRKREDEETIQKRFSLAKKEIAFAESTDVYDVFVVNDDFNRAVAEIEKLIRRRLAEGQEPTLF